MTDITVKLDPETGAATIELRGAAVAEPRFRLRDVATEKFLTRRGWSKTPSFLPGEAVTAADFTVLVVDADLARRITPGMNLSLEQPASNIFATVSWPMAGDASAEDMEVPPAAIPAAAEVTAPVAEDIDEMTAAAERDAARLKDDAPTGDAPASLEPSVRDESTVSFRAVDADRATPGKAKFAPILNDDDDEHDDGGTSWGRLAAAALLFMLLGSVLTYFWQSSAYDNELRTAMRPLEGLLAQQKADFEKRLAQAEADAGGSSDETVTSANAQVASLTTQTEDLTKDRDAALTEVSEQQAKVKTLEERLLTAQGEIESLKAAAAASATEQTAVFNDRIDALGKELDAARGELEKNRADLATREQALTTSDARLKTANTEIATLRKAGEDRQAAQTEEVEGRIAVLSAQLDKAAQDLATRDASLREVQSQLSVITVQKEALEKLAGKAGEADLERTTLADRITELTSQIDKAEKDLAARDAELRKTRTSLETANALVESGAAELERLKAASTSQVATAPGADSQRLQQERDLYAEEVRAMTRSFNDLKAERDRLAAALERAGTDTAALDTEASTPASRAFWGATAIDQTGAVYSIQNQTTQKSASDNAIARCRSESDGRCEPLRTYQNSCFSLARIEGEGPRNDNFGFSIGRDRKASEAAAMRECEQLGASCTVRFTACSSDSLSKPAVNQ